ncbi:MAG: cache domain-containing protein [Thermodesulfobacteriota bacterium]|nr:cache domain-containing protein [Thermodesulfobacteriota bacterium]
MKKPSWRFKLIILFVAVLTISLLIQIFYVTPYIRNREIENTKIYQEEVANNIARELDVGLNRIKNRLLRMSVLPEFRKMNIEAMQRIILDQEIVSERISTIAVMNSEGFFVCSSISEKKFSEYTTQSYEDKPYFAIPFDEGKIYFSPPRYYTEENLVSTAVCIPIESESGKRVGVLIGSMDLKDIIKRVFAYPLEKGQEASITTKEGTIIAHSDVDLFTLKDNPLSLKSDCTLKQEIFESGKDGSIKHKHKEIDYYGSYVFLESNGWLVAVESSMESILNQSSKMFQKILLIELLLFAIALIITIFFAGQITKAQRKAEKALRDSEFRFIELFDNMGSGVAVYEVIDDGKDFIFTDFNKAAERIDNCKKENIIGKSIFEMRQGVENLGLIDVFLKVWKTGKSAFHPISFYQDEIISKWYENYVYKLPTGEIVTIFDDVTERKQAEEKIKEKSIELEKQFEKSEKQRIATLSVLTDLNKTTVNLKAEITERKQGEEEKEKLHAQLLQSQKMEAIGTLAGGVAHDFNNLLTIIIGSAELALMNIGEDNDIYKNITEIRNTGDRAASLTRQLLAFSRKQLIQPITLNLNETLTTLEKMLHRLIGEDIDLTTVFDPDLYKIEADPGQIEQVVMNLTVNARDAMPKGGKLTIETTNMGLDTGYFKDHGVESQPGPYVMLAITDTGKGMDRETQSRIFEPFFTTKERGRGTGLGLSTVYGIVKQNHGHIWVYSEPESGTTFKIYFPMSQKNTETIKKDQSPESSLKGAETILIVEDDETLCAMTKMILKGYGYNILTALNGEEGLKKISNHKGTIDLLLTDVVMPGMDGKKLAGIIQEKHPDIKIIYMSGYTDNAIANYGILEEGLNFIQKPFSRKDLARKVREALD